MSSINFPKRKKDIDHCEPKRGESQQLFNKTTKRKASRKNFLSSMATKTTLMQSSSMTKLKAPTKKTKPKNSKSKNKIERTGKQNKKTQQVSVKTLKKLTKKKKQIIQKQQQLTERKKIHLEYFMYKDTYVPIQNTEQRKIIYKIQLIDQKSIKSEEPAKPTTPRTKIVQKQIIAPPKKLVDTATQRTDRKLYNVDFQCQTQQAKQKLIQPVELRFSEQSQQLESDQQKCFAQTLSQLQFLYLPDQKNFEGFTKTEKAHYKELLLYIAKKFDDEPENPLYDEATVQLFLQEREMRQRGVIQSFPKNGFPTHTLAITSYISNLFCYLQIHEKNSLIERINCSYGYNLQQKLKRVREGKSTTRTAFLIPQSTFWKFQTQLHQGLPIHGQYFEEALHAHNRAIFDATNQILLQFQPYYNSRGEPFPWSYNYQSTFFCITEQSFGALANQIKDRIWQYSNILSGILLQVPSEQKYKIHIHKILLNERNMLNGQTKKYNQSLQIEQQRTRMFCQVSDQIYNQLINQLVNMLSQQSSLQLNGFTNFCF